MTKLFAVVVCLLAGFGHNEAQDCVSANSDGADALPCFSDPGNSAPRIGVNPIQVIIKSYQFHCCGKVGGWAAFVEPGGGNHENGVYSIKFQIWRPSDNNKYVKVGENSFPLLTLPEASRIEEQLSNNEQLDFQPGDVVGYYLEDNDNQNGGVQFESDFNIEEVWYATGNSALQDECLLEVGSAGDLSMSTSLGPFISISLTTTVNNCPSTFTSTMFCPIPTMSLRTQPITVAVSTPVIPSSTIMLPPVVSSTPLNIAFLSSTFQPPVLPSTTPPPVVATTPPLVVVPPSSTPLPVVVPPSTTPPPVVVPTRPASTPSIVTPSTLCNEGCRTSAVTTSHRQPTPTLITPPTQPSAITDLRLYIGVSVGLLVLVLLSLSLVGLSWGLMIRNKRKKAQRGLTLVGYKNSHTGANIVGNENNANPSTENNVAYLEQTKPTTSDYEYATTTPSVIRTCDLTATTINPAYRDVTRGEEVDYTYVELNNKDQAEKDYEEDPTLNTVVDQNPAYSGMVVAPTDEYTYHYVKKDFSSKEENGLGVSQNTSYGVVQENNKSNPSTPTTESTAYTNPDPSIPTGENAAYIDTNPPIPTRENQAYITTNIDSELYTYDYVRR